MRVIATRIFKDKTKPNALIQVNGSTGHNVQSSKYHGGRSVLVLNPLHIPNDLQVLSIAFILDFELDNY